MSSRISLGIIEVMCIFLNVRKIGISVEIMLEDISAALGRANDDEIWKTAMFFVKFILLVTCLQNTLRVFQTIRRKKQNILYKPRAVSYTEYDIMIKYLNSSRT